MTTPNYRSPTAQGEQDTGTKDQAKQTASTAAEQGKHVAGVAKDEAQQVTSEVKHQARNVVGEVRTQVEEQSRTQRDRLVSTLQTFSDDLEQMSANSEGGLASDLVRQGAERVRSFTDTMADREPSELLDEVRSFARRRPGTFLLGALVAGVVAGRLARGARDAGNGSAAGSPHDDLRSASIDSLGATGYPRDTPVGTSGVGTSPSGLPPTASGSRAPAVDPLAAPARETGDRLGTGSPRTGDRLGTGSPRTGDPLSGDALRDEDPLRPEGQPWSDDPRRGPHD